MVILMLKQNNQLELNFSKYSELYNIIIKADNFCKTIKWNGRFFICIWGIKI